MKSLLILTFATLIIGSFSRTAEEWKTRVVYQIITDRFAKTDGDTSPCHNLGQRCGGTFKGIQNNLDYVQELGFNAIWISPVVANTYGGYHGYWAKDLYSINPDFGTAEELKELIDACHERDIWVMVDVIANHMGYVDNWDYSSLIPFNDASHFNNYRDCRDVPSWDHEGQETCWLHGLPDLNQNNEFVRNTLLEWIHDFIQTYSIDGIRLDALRHVPRSFWNDFSQAAGVFTIGEVFDFDLPYLASYQGPVDSLLNFPFYSSMRYVFEKGGSMNSLEHYYNGASATWSDMSVLGNFINNHDIPRFLHNNGNVPGFKAALAFSISSVGIPTVYYGDEQGFGGGSDPENREALWIKMDRENEFFKFIKTLNNFRKETEFYKYDQIQRYSDDTFYAFSRGEHFFAFTNNHDYQVRTISYHPYSEGTKLCNVFHPKDCVEVINGEFQVVLIGGEAKILSPHVRSEFDEQGERVSAWKKIKNSWAENLSLDIKRMSSLTRMSL